MIIKSKRGQIKIQQMAFMLIAVVLLFAIVGLVFVSIRFYNVKKISASLEEVYFILVYFDYLFKVQM